MTATADLKVKDGEFVSSGLIGSASVNSFADFIPSKLKESHVTKENGKDDFINTFICHLIFYCFLCVSIVLHIFIDLGLAALVKKQFLLLFESAKNTVVVKTPAFA